MAGIGEASAILAFVQIGFSFATALKEYIVDVKDVPKEVLSLPGSVLEALGLVKEVEYLLSLNQQTRAWTAEGIERAQGNIRYCQVIITTLQEVLQKADIPLDGKPTKEDINISAFDKATWPFVQKPKVKKAKKDLQEFYSQVTVTILTYQVRTSTTAVQKAASEQRLARLLAERMSDPKPQVGFGKQRDQDDGKTIKDAVHDYRESRKQSKRKTRTSLSPRENDGYESLDEICNMLKDLARAEFVREDAIAKAEAESRQKEQEKAVKAWQKDAKSQVDDQQSRRKQLRTELNGKLESAAIEHVVSTMFPISAEQALLGYGSTDAVHVPDASSMMSASELTHGWSRSFLGRRAVKQPEITAELREMLSPAGRASLKGFVIAYDREQRIQVAPMGAPQQVLLEKHYMGPSKTNRGSIRPKPWAEYSLLPTLLRTTIDEKLEDLGYDWSLVHVERLMKPQKRHRLRRNVEQLQGVYVIFNNSVQVAQQKEELLSCEGTERGNPRMTQHEHYVERVRRESGSDGSPRRRPLTRFRDRVATVIHRDRRQDTSAYCDPRSTTPSPPRRRSRERERSRSGRRRTETYIYEPASFPPRSARRQERRSTYDPPFYAQPMPPTSAPPGYQYIMVPIPPLPPGNMMPQDGYYDDYDEPRGRLNARRSSQRVKHSRERVSQHHLYESPSSIQLQFEAEEGRRGHARAGLKASASNMGRSAPTPVQPRMARYDTTRYDSYYSESDSSSDSKGRSRSRTRRDEPMAASERAVAALLAELTTAETGTETGASGPYSEAANELMVEPPVQAPTAGYRVPESNTEAGATYRAPVAESYVDAEQD